MNNLEKTTTDAFMEFANEIGNYSYYEDVKTCVSVWYYNSESIFKFLNNSYVTSKGINYELINKTNENETLNAKLFTSCLVFNQINDMELITQTIKNEVEINIKMNVSNLNLDYYTIVDENEGSNVKIPIGTNCFMFNGKLILFPCTLKEIENDSYIVENSHCFFDK